MMKAVTMKGGEALEHLQQRREGIKELIGTDDLGDKVANALTRDDIYKQLYYDGSFT